MTTVVEISFPGDGNELSVIPVENKDPVSFTLYYIGGQVVMETRP